MTQPYFYDQTKLDALLSAKVNSVSLAKVATTGSYSDLTSKPTIPATAADVSAVPTSRKVNGHPLTSDFSIALSELTGVGTAAQAAPLSVMWVKKDATTGFWPASYNSDGTANYTNGSATAGVRPTSRSDVMVIWKGADPSPGIVTTGTGGMLDGVDERHLL